MSAPRPRAPAPPPTAAPSPTTTANALIFGAGITTGGFSTAGTNYATRIITTPDQDIAEDRIVTTTGAYSATAPLKSSAAWVMQVATFRAVAAAAVAPPAFVQVSAAVPQTSQSAVPVTYTGAQVAGDTNIVAIGWNNTTSTITSVTDSAGNTYQLAVPTARGGGVSQAIYYAPNIKAAAAGTNTVTATFDAPTPYVDLRAIEYSGLDPVNPFDVGTSASGTGTAANSGTVRTTTANALIFGAGITTGGFSTAGTNYATRIITTPDRDIAEDRIVTATGAYSATAPLSGSAAWVMQVATFRAAGATTAAAPPYPASVSGRKILDQYGRRLSDAHVLVVGHGPTARAGRDHICARSRRRERVQRRHRVDRWRLRPRLERAPVHERERRRLLDRHPVGVGPR